MTSINSTILEKSLGQKVLKILLRILKSMATSPTTVWFVSLYIFGLLSMVFFNIARVGLNQDGIFGGPYYYTNLFLHFGLNNSSTYQSPLLTNPFLTTLFAPYLAIFFGMAFFMIPNAGRAFNSTGFSPQEGANSFAFFNQDVYGFEISFLFPKLNLFYIGIVWLPIIASSIITIYYKNWLSRETSLVSRSIINLIIAYFVGVEFAKMTDPNFKYVWQNFIPSILSERRNQTFVVYSGQYFPLMLMTILFFYQFIPIIVMGLIENGYKSSKVLLQTWKHRSVSMKDITTELPEEYKNIDWLTKNITDNKSVPKKEV